MKVLVATHEAETRTPGGAQRSAGALVESLSQLPGIEASLVAAVPEDDRPTGEDVVVSQTDAAFFSWDDPRSATAWRELLARVRPNVVHLHHYYHLGIELPRVVHSVLPDAAVVLTLHEYMAICLRSGQMVDGEGGLCLSAGVRKCATCVSWAVETVAARDDYVRRGLSDVDIFLTPSAFTRWRYVDWGIAPEAVREVPNVVTLGRAGVGRRRSRDGGLALAYIGQHTPNKGIEVLLDAVERLHTSSPQALRSLEVFGDGSDRFDPVFHDRLSARLASASPLVRVRGRYQQSELAAILDSVDAIVVPSTWWENSPVVIEEALARRVPVICSDIGGMAEKVRDGIDGWQFRAGSAASLAAVIARLAADPDVSLPMMRVPPPPVEVAQRHVDAYVEAVRRRAGARG